MRTFQLPGLANLTAGSLYCIGRNYVEHARELDNEVPSEPLVFLKPRSSIIYSGERVTLPRQSGEVHHEVELVAAVGQSVRNISEAEALRCIAGYAVGIDLTARDIQQRAKERSHPWTVSKGFDTFAPIGPFITAERAGNPQEMELELSVNGQVRQKANTRLMIFPVAQLVAYLSTVFTLHPGDLIFTGTPAGVAPLATGDRMEASLNGTDSILRVDVE